MSHVTMEQLLLSDTSPGSLAFDIVSHYLTQGAKQSALILTNDPLVLMQITRREWCQAIRSLEYRRLRAMDGAVIRKLSHELTKLQGIRFCSELTYDQIDPAISFSQGVYPTDIRLIYITPSFNRTSQEQVMKLVKKGTLVVSYSQTKGGHSL